MELWKTILIFGLLAILFDGIWATIAKVKGFAYYKGMWVSFLIYAIASIVATRSGTFLDGVISGAGVAGIEATIGWWVSWIIGPGRLPETISRDAYPKTIINSIGRVILTGAFIGLLISSLIILF